MNEGCSIRPEIYSMILVCPKPIPWCRIHADLSDFALANSLPAPPQPLVLSAWFYTNDLNKQSRWLEMVAWARKYNCERLIRIPDNEFYYAEELSTHEIGPMGNPLRLPWSSKPKPVPDHAVIGTAIDVLKNCWPEIAGPIVAPLTTPLRFTGAKMRRLLVSYTNGTPPWGDWHRLSLIECERRSFTALRASVNVAIDPHHVDHIEFMHISRLA